MKRTLRSGKVIEKSQFFVGTRKPRADRRKGSSSAARMDVNMNLAVRRFARILNCNFDPDDILITLTYSDEHLPADYKEADRLIGLFLRRLKRLGVDARGVWLTADKDKRGNAERLHHHMIIKGDGIQMRRDGEKLIACVSGKKLEDIWGCGILHAEHLEQQDDYTPLAAYLVRQAVAVADAKKWHSSRGLEKPVIEEEIITDQADELRAPGGAEVLEVGHYDQETGSHYIRYIRRPKKAKEGRVDETVKRNFVNHYGLRGYKLPPKTFKRARYLVEDYPRIKREYEDMLTDSKRSDGQPRGTDPGNPTATIAARRAQLGDDIRAVEKALEYIPKEYADPIEKHVKDGTLYPLSVMARKERGRTPAHRNTWQNWIQPYLYMVAILRGY